MPKIHKFQESLDRGKNAEQHLNKVFANIGKVFQHGEQWIVIKSTEVHDRKQGVDALHLDPNNCEIIHRVDYKLDSRATQFSHHPAIGPEGQLTLEDYSEFATGPKPGWVHTSKADRIVSYIPNLEAAHCLILSRIRELWPQIKNVGHTKAMNEGWVTFNYLTPVHWLRLHGIIERTVSTKTSKVFAKNAATGKCFHCNGTMKCECIICDNGKCVACLE